MDAVVKSQFELSIVSGFKLDYRSARGLGAHGYLPEMDPEIRVRKAAWLLDREKCPNQSDSRIKPDCRSRNSGRSAGPRHVQSG